MKTFLTIFVLFFSSSLVAAEKLMLIDDGKNINELELLIEEIDKCTTVKEVEDEIKYVLYNSNIKISENSPYKLYVNINLKEQEFEPNFCHGSITFTIYSITKSGVAKKIIHWEKGSITIKSYPYDNHINSLVNIFTKNAVIWIKENTI